MEQTLAIVDQADAKKSLLVQTALLIKISRHRVRRANCGSFILSMTFCTRPHTSRLKGTIRRSKDIAYFGVRALWS
ncbi:MAG TPA: hypothetical protein P5149_02595 [Candidatus Competibacteraceae bacterium]|nr:hypothetical protein [Candidatus Competibacteraceae bacterium]